MSKFPLTVRQIAKIVGGTVQGDDSVRIEAIAPLNEAGPTDLTLAADSRRAAKLQTSQAGAALVTDEPAEAPMTLIRTEHIPEALAKLLGALAPAEYLPAAGVDATAKIDQAAQVAADAAVGPYVVVGPGAQVDAGSVLCAGVQLSRDVRIGAGTILHEGVVVKQGCTIGDRVIIGPNSVIGFDGFGYYFKDGLHNKTPHIGTVVIEDDVEIGPCSCVDRAKFAQTRIGKGTKIDNLVQIAHNVRIGQACILAGQVGIAGSVKLGDGVVLGGHSGVRDNVSLGDGVTVGGFSAIAGDLEPGATVAGIPAGPVREKMRALMALDKLPEMNKHLKSLEKRLSALESTDDH